MSESATATMLAGPMRESCPESEAGSSSSAKSAERALEVLRLLSGRPRPVPTMMIARQCAIPRSSAYHLLKVMREREWVQYHEQTRGWTLGPATCEISFGYVRHDRLEHAATPVMRELAAGLNCTVHLALLSGAEVVYLRKEQPPGSTLQLVTDHGVRLPAHLTSVGLAMLAMLGHAEVSARFARRPLPRLTSSGPRDVEDLQRRVDTTGRRGFALECGMVSAGIACLGVAVRVPSAERTVAALGLTWERGDETVRDPARLVPFAVDASNALERRLAADVVQAAPI